MEITIIGMGKGRKSAPEGGIRWGITRTVLDQDIDLLFDVHTMNANDAFLKRLKICEEKGIKALTAGKIEGYPASEPYPLFQIISEFKCTYFPDSVSYAIAYAVFRGAKKLNLYGVNQSRKLPEYYRNKGGTEYWIGFARGRGIEVNVYGDFTEVCKTYNYKMYGFDFDQGAALSVRDL